MKYILNDDGEPVLCDDVELWVAWFVDHENEREVAYDLVRDVEVSTVFLGVDLNYLGLRGGPPKVFETMIFGGPLDRECRRYSTRAEALAGHQLLVDAAKAGPRGHK